MGDDYQRQVYQLNQLPENQVRLRLIRRRATPPRVARVSTRGLSRRAHRILGTRVVSSERDAAACGVRRAREAVSRRDHATTTSEQKRETDERLDPSPRRILVARPVSRSTTRHRNPFDVNQ